jgi:predicted site-specific integrase-resolvase
MSDNSYLTIKQAAKILGVAPLTLRNWDKSGKFPARRHPMNNYRVYRIEDLKKVYGGIETGNVSVNSRDQVRKLIVKHLRENGEE